MRTCRHCRGGAELWKLFESNGNLDYKEVYSWAMSSMVEMEALTVQAVAWTLNRCRVIGVGQVDGEKDATVVEEITVDGTP